MRVRSIDSKCCRNWVDAQRRPDAAPKPVTQGRDGRAVESPALKPQFVASFGMRPACQTSPGSSVYSVLSGFSLHCFTSTAFFSNFHPEPPKALAYHTRAAPRPCSRLPYPGGDLAHLSCAWEQGHALSVSSPFCSSFRLGLWSQLCPHGAACSDTVLCPHTSHPICLSTVLLTCIL